MRYAGIRERTPAGNWASSQISSGQGQNSKSSGEALEVSWQEVQKHGRNLTTATRNIKKPLFPRFPTMWVSRDGLFPWRGSQPLLG